MAGPGLTSTLIGREMALYRVPGSGTHAPGRQSRAAQPAQTGPRSPAEIAESQPLSFSAPVTTCQVGDHCDSTVSKGGSRRRGSQAGQQGAHAQLGLDAAFDLGGELRVVHLHFLRLPPGSHFLRSEAGERASPGPGQPGRRTTMTSVTSAWIWSFFGPGISLCTTCTTLDVPYKKMV